MDHRRVIVALDVPERDRTLKLAKSLAADAAMVKLGLESFVAYGPSLVQEVIDLGVDVFLDLKLHDIPRTVAAAAREASSLGARILTVHAGGGAEMIRAARENADDGLAVAAVTVLTSLDEATVGSIGFVDGVAGSVRRLGQLAIEAGADALVCSALELVELEALPGQRIVPGVRPAASDADDQRRVATPTQALESGATFLVIGRPITQAEDPSAALRSINASLANASSRRS
ncbi:MAG: orotidine-5'-phosphate decarboxylase [Myxococcota bacterium]